MEPIGASLPEGVAFCYHLSFVEGVLTLRRFGPHLTDLSSWSIAVHRYDYPDRNGFGRTPADAIGARDLFEGGFEGKRLSINFIRKTGGRWWWLFVM